MEPRIVFLQPKIGAVGDTGQNITALPNPGTKSPSKLQQADAAEIATVVQESVVTVEQITETKADIDKGVDGTMDSTAQLLPGGEHHVKTANQHPPSFSRLPPDGHEFPPNYMEPSSHQDISNNQLQKFVEHTATKQDKIKMESEQTKFAQPSVDIKTSEEKSINPPLPRSVPPLQTSKVKSHNDSPTSDKVARKLSGDLLLIKSKDEVDEAAKYSARKHSVGSSEDKTAISDSLKLKNWRKDVKSSCSVRDKIAMFSNTHEPEQPLFPSPAVVYTPSKRLSKTFKSSEDVFNGDDTTTTMSKRFSKSSMSIENTGITPVSPDGHSVTKSVVPIDSSPEKPIQRYCSMDFQGKITEENNDEINTITLNTFNTLPRSTEKVISNGILTRTTSFSGPQYIDSQNNTNGKPCMPSKLNEEQRKNSLNLLIEQRRRSISKLRGLVIPEKVPEIQSIAPIIDLPEIKSSNCILNKPRVQTKTPDYSTITPVRISPQLVSPPPWKSPQNNNVPKYSPAFKRKSLQLYSTRTSETDAVNGNAVNDNVEIKKTPAKPPRTSLVNGNGYRKSSLTNSDSPKSLDSAIDNYDYLENNKSLTSSKSVLHDSRTDDDSDNDSAVSSSQSSYASRDYSSPPSPHSALCRTPSSETASSATSTLTSGSHPSSCCGSNSSSSAGCGRVLKPQSVEAINRKNILASAKCRSGRDLNGSPLIQRKFDEDSTDGNEEPPSAPRYSRVKQTTTPVAAYSETDSTEPSSLEYGLAQQEPASDSDTEIRKWVRNEAKYVVAPTTAITPVTTSRTRRSLLEDSDSGDLMDMLSNSNNKTPSPVTRSKTDILLKEKRSTSVNDIRKTFEKTSPTSQFATGRSKLMNNHKDNNNGLIYNHQRISSLDSTTSEGSSGVSSMLANGQNNHSGSSNNLQSGDFGSISSLASSTSVISQQELQQLIDEANSVSEGACSPSSNSSTMALGDALVIVLHRDAPGSSVGITLAGGADYETKEITIHKVLVGSPADRDGRVQKGDRVLSINGKSMKGVTHRESLAILKAPRSEVVLVTSKSKGLNAPSVASASKSIRKSILLQPSNLQSPSDEQKILPLSDPNALTITLEKQGASLGFSLEGGVDSPLGDKPLLIKKIFTGGAADKDNLLRAGDELIKVNDQFVTYLSRVEVWSMMKRLPNGPVEITIKR